MAGQRAAYRHRSLLNGRRGLPVGSGLLLLLVAGWLLPAEGLAGPTVRSRGRAVVSFAQDPAAPPEEAVRFEVNAVFSSESSSFGGGVLCRFELPEVVRDAPDGPRLGVVVVDVDLDALRAVGTLPFQHPAAELRYHEMRRGAETAFEGLLRGGEVELYGYTWSRSDLVLHLGFHAEVFDPASGETRRLFDAEARTLSASASQLNEAAWHSDDPADVVSVTGYYDRTDCGGSPLYGEYVDDPVWSTTDWDDDYDYDSGWDDSGSDYDDSGNNYDDYNYDDYDYDDSGNSWDWDDGGSDPGDGCSDDPGSDDSEALDCGGDEPGGGGKYGDSGDSGCDGGDSGSDEGLDCADEAFAATGSAPPPDKQRRARRRRWRGWNLAPLLGAVGWWLFLKRRRRGERDALARWTPAAG